MVGIGDGAQLVVCRDVVGMLVLILWLWSMCTCRGEWVGGVLGGESVFRMCSIIVILWQYVNN